MLRRRSFLFPFCFGPSSLWRVYFIDDRLEATFFFRTIEIWASAFSFVSQIPFFVSSRVNTYSLLSVFFLLIVLIILFFQMRNVAAYLLLVLGGNANPSAADIKKVITAGGATADDAAIEKLLASLKGKSLEEVLKAGKEKLAAVPSAGAAAPAASAPAAAKGAAPAASAPAKKEEPKKEEKPESDDMGFDLFG